MQSEKNYFIYQLMYFCNSPRQDDCQTDFFLQKYLLCLISYLALYSLLLETRPGTETFQHWQPADPVDVCAEGEPLGVALQAHSSPWRSALYQLCLRIQGYPPPTSTCLPACGQLFHLLRVSGFGVSCCCGRSRLPSVASSSCCFQVISKRGREMKRGDSLLSRFQL